MVKLQIAVFGSSSTKDRKVLAVAEQVGKLIAQRGATLFCGNVKGILGAALKGAKAENGQTAVVAPYDHKDIDLSNCDVYIASSLNWFARGSSLVNSLDGIIVISGGIGTLTEMAYAWWQEIPIVVIKTGGINDQYIGKGFDPRKKHKVVGADSAEEGVRKLFKMLS